MPRTDQQPGLPTECPICGNYQWKQIGLPDHTFRVTFGCGTRWFGLGNGVMESMQRHPMCKARTEFDCPECPGTIGEHCPDCGVGHDDSNQPTRETT